MKNYKIVFICINEDGEERRWSMTPSELYKEFFGACDLPNLNDPIDSCTYNGTPLSFDTFSDLLSAFGIE